MSFVRQFKLFVMETYFNDYNGNYTFFELDSDFKSKNSLRRCVHKKENENYKGISFIAIKMLNDKIIRFGTMIDLSLVKNKEITDYIDSWKNDKCFKFNTFVSNKRVIFFDLNQEETNELVKLYEYLKL